VGLPKEMMTRMMHMMHKHSRRQMKAVLLVALAIPFVPGQYSLETGRLMPKFVLSSADC